MMITSHRTILRSTINSCSRLMISTPPRNDSVMDELGMVLNLLVHGILCCSLRSNPFMKHI